jgi:uncharacterized phage protein gp47/JayE
MVADTDSFINIEGTEINRTVLVNYMIKYFRDALNSDETEITDFNEGSEIRNLLESIAVDLYNVMYNQYVESKVCFLKYAYNQWLDLIGEELKLYRDLGCRSVGTVTFTLLKTLTYDLTIPAETLLYSSETNAEYKTDADCTIVAGSLTVTTAAHSSSVGKSMNADIGTITKFGKIIVSTLEVTNTVKFTDGRNPETDSSYRARLLSFERQDTFGSASWYSNLCTTIVGVHDIAFKPSETYTKEILVNGDEKPTLQSVLLACQTALTTQTNLVIGHSFTVNRPTYISTDLIIRLYTSTNIQQSEYESCLTALFDGGVYNNIEYDGFNIAEDVTKVRIINAIESMVGVTQVESITKDQGTNFDSLDVGDYEVLKFNSVTVEVLSAT